MIGLGKFTLTALLASKASAFVGVAPSMSVRGMSMLKKGDKLPMDSSFQILRDGKPTDVAASEIFGGKKVVVCGVPGAMTPTCSEQHLPGFIEKAADMKKKGVDSIACLSVNDAFVMGAWGKALGADDKVEMLADGGANFVKATGLEFDTGGFGGSRCTRMSMLVEDGVVLAINMEEGGGFTDSSSAESMLKAL